MSNHDDTMNKVHRYARGLFGETDYHESIAPTLANLQPQYHKMLTEQIGAQLTRKHLEGFDHKSAFAQALMNTLNYQLNPDGEDDRHKDEIESQFTQAYDAHEDNYDALDEHSEDKGHTGSEMNWDTHPGAVFAAKLGSEKATTLGYHLSTGGQHLPAGQQKYWHSLQNKLKQNNELLYSIPQNVNHQQYEQAKASGGNDNLIQSAYSALSSDDAMKSHGYSSEKDEKLFESGRLSSKWLAENMLTNIGERYNDKDVQRMENKILAAYGKAKRQSDVDFGMHGVQSGFKTDLLRDLFPASHLPEFMKKSPEQYTKDDWSTIKSYNFALNNISRMLFEGGDKEEVASRKQKFDAFKPNEFNELKDEMARVSDNDAATYLTTSGNPNDAVSEQRYNELEAMGLEKTGENFEKLNEVYEGTASLDDMFPKTGKAYGRQRRTAKDVRNNVTQTREIISELKQRYPTTVTEHDTEHVVESTPTATEPVIEAAQTAIEPTTKPIPTVTEFAPVVPTVTEVVTESTPTAARPVTEPVIESVSTVPTDTKPVSTDIEPVSTVTEPVIKHVPTNTKPATKSTPALTRPATKPVPTTNKSTAPSVAPPVLDDSFINSAIHNFQASQTQEPSMNASGHVDLTAEATKDSDETAARILRSMGLDVSEHAQRSDEWHQEKKGRLSGTTAQSQAKAGRAGLVSSLEDYVGISQNPQTFHSSLFERGEKDEPVIQEHMEKLFKSRGLNYGIGNAGFITNPSMPNYGYSPDGIIYNKDDDSLVGIAEYKSVDKVIHGGDAWNKKYMAQVQLGMHVLGAEKAYHTQLGKAEWENGKLIRPSYTAEVTRDPNFNPEEHEFSKRKDLIDQYRGMRSDKELANLFTGMSNEQVRRMSDLTGIANESSDSSRIKNGLLAAFEQMAQDGGDKYPAMLSNKKAEEAKQEREKERDEAKQAKEQEKEAAEREAARREAWDRGYRGTQNVVRGIGDIFGGGMMDTLKGSVDFTDRFGGLLGSVLKTGAGIGESAFAVGDEIKERIGEALDAGYTNTYEHKSQATALQMMGMNEAQARHAVNSFADVRNLATIGETGPLGNMLGAFRGLLHTEDVMRFGSDPDALVHLINKRAKEAGYTEQQVAGMATKSGIQGLARTFSLDSDENFIAQRERIQSSRDKGTLGTDTLREWVGDHARNKPENTEKWEDAQQWLSEQGSSTFKGLANAADAATQKLTEFAQFLGAASGQQNSSIESIQEKVNKDFNVNVTPTTYSPLSKNEDGSLTPFGKMRSGDYEWTLKSGFQPKKGVPSLVVSKGKEEKVFDATVAETEYDQASLESLEGQYDLDTLNNDIADLKETPDTDMYKSLLKSIRSSTKETSGSVDVKVTVMGDDTANIVVSKNNRVLTERKVKYTQASN